MGSSVLPGIVLDRFSECSKKESDWPVCRSWLPCATLGDEGGLPKSCWPAQHGQEVRQITHIQASLDDHSGAVAVRLLTAERSLMLLHATVQSA